MAEIQNIYEAKGQIIIFNTKIDYRTYKILGQNNYQLATV